MSQPTETNWAYLAGMIDGEGYIDILMRRTPSHKKLKKGYAREFRLQIGSASRSHLELLQAMFRPVANGTITLHKTDGKWNHKTDFYTLRFCPTAIRVILPRVIPYLQIKSRAAQIMLNALTKITEIPNAEEREKVILQLHKIFRLEVLKTEGSKRRHRLDDDILFPTNCKKETEK